jgi:hypothetical protein
VDNRSAAARPTTYRNLFTETFVWRLTVLGAATFGFLVTFMLLYHEIRALYNVILPLLAILAAYLFLMSLNMWWAAMATAKLGQKAGPLTAEGVRRLRTTRVVQACCGLVFGVLAALWYVHSVSG